MKKNKKHQKRMPSNRADKKVLSQDAINLLIENLRLSQDNAKLSAWVLSWKTAWFDQRDISGKAAWQMPPEGYGKTSNEVNTIHIFDFKLDQPCSAEETKARVAKAKEVSKEYMIPKTNWDIIQKETERQEKVPRVFGSAAGKIYYQTKNIPIDLFSNLDQVEHDKLIIKYDAWQTYLNRLRE